MRICINKQKIRLFHWFALEMWSIKKSCNLTGWGDFGQYLRSNKFSQIWDLWGNKANDINFHYWTNSVKFKTNFLNKFKKPCFWPIYDLFSQCYGHTILLKNPPLLCTTLYGLFICFYCWLKQVNVRWVDIKALKPFIEMQYIQFYN